MNSQKLQYNFFEESLCQKFLQISLFERLFPSRGYHIAQRSHLSHLRVCKMGVGVVIFRLGYLKWLQMTRTHVFLYSPAPPGGCILRWMSNARNRYDIVRFLTNALASAQSVKSTQHGIVSYITGIRVWECNIFKLFSAHLQNISFYRKYHFTEWSCLDFENQIYHFTEISF